MPGEQCRVVLPLLRREGQAAFSKEELRLLHTAAPVVKEVVRLAWAARGQPPEDAIEPSEHVREVYKHFGQKLLTPRDCKVAQSRSRSSCASPGVQ